MQTEQILSLVTGMSGRHVNVQFQTEGKPSKDHKGVVLQKKTDGTFRVGISFENLKGVREGIESGERGQVEAPKGRKWVSYPFVLSNLDETQQYLRLYYPTGGAIQSPDVTYLVDGKEVEKDEYLSYLTESDRKPKPKNPNMDCFDVKIGNILKIG